MNRPFLSLVLAEVFPALSFMSLMVSPFGTQWVTLSESVRHGRAY